jgi:hypothetical protein
LRITTTDMVHVNKGVEWIAASTLESDFGATQCHIASVVAGIHLGNVMDIHICGNSFYVSDAVDASVGVLLDYAAGSVVGNLFQGTGSQTIGVSCTNTPTSSYTNFATVIDGNAFRNTNTAISLGSSVSNVSVGAGNVFGNVTTRVSNSGSGNTITSLAAAGVLSHQGSLLIGPTSQINAPSGVLSALQVAGTGAATSAQLIARFQNGPSGPLLLFSKSRGATVGASGAVQSGDDLGTINFYGDDGTEERLAASMLAEVDGTPGSSDMPGRLTLATTPDGSATPATRQPLLRMQRMASSMFRRVQAPRPGRRRVTPEGAPLSSIRRTTSCTSIPGVLGAMPGLNVKTAQRLIAAGAL